MSGPAHGGQLRALSARFGIPDGNLLDFSANINPEGPPAAVAEAIRSALLDPTCFTLYPDLDELHLRQAISRYAEIPPEAIAVSNGFVPLLEAVLRTWPIHRCLIPVPCFTEYRRTLVMAGVEPVTHALDTSFAYQPDLLLRQALATGCQAILLANPQNPTGLLTSRASLLNLVRAAAERQILILLDEAFIDYTPAESLSADTSSYSNLIVFRSVTKFHAIPGLRVAYTLSADASSLRGRLAPWAITTLAATGVIAALADLPYASRARSLNLARRNALRTGLEELELFPYPASANFLLMRLPDTWDAPSIWERLVVDHGIVTRLCLDYENLSRQHLRIAVRSEPENLRLLSAFRSLSGVRD